MLITNDPWQGTGHLSDVCLVKPIFRDGRLVAFSATTSHMPDIGGRIRAIEAREVFEEGFHIPLDQADARRAVPDETLISLLREPTCARRTRRSATSGRRSSANELMENRRARA